MNWKHGYYADSGYTYGYYPETTPLRLAWAALIQGHQTPTRNFRYLDAGCGQGLSLLMMAAAHPDAEFVGIDFLPEHIAHATELARSCGLGNVRFIEGDFVELQKDPSSLGSFDYAVCHGITTWIAPVVKQALFALIGKVLKPGGLFYNSYNTFPGWLSTAPFQHLVLLEQRSQTGSLALKSARQSMDKLKDVATSLYGALPGLLPRLQRMDSQDPAYLVQEYNNQFWQPVFVSQMIDEMAAVKLSYLGTATLPEIYDSSYVASLRELLSQQPTPQVREQVRDFGVNQSFRRDLYVKGRSRPWQQGLQAQLKAFGIALNPEIARPDRDAAYTIKAGTIELNGEPSFYHALMDLLAAQPSGMTVGELADMAPASRNWLGVVQAVAMLLHGGWVVLTQDECDVQPAQRCNRVLARAVCAGAPYRYASLPRAGGALSTSETDFMVIAALMDGKPPNEWAAAVSTCLEQLGRQVVKGGSPINDPAARQQVIEEAVQRFKDVRLPFFRAMGAF